MSKGSASSLTEASPDARRDRIARRVGSARAAKIASSCEEEKVALCITDWLYKAPVESGQGGKRAPGTRERLNLLSALVLAPIALISVALVIMSGARVVQF